jgi:hypothetical protein
MRARLTTTLLACLAAGLLACSTAGAGMVGIYRNGMETLSQRSQLIKLTGRSCSRAGVGGALRITLGKRTDSCAFRSPVVGRDLEIAATERLLSTTPMPLQHAAYLGLELRAGGGAKYRLLVFPLQRKVQLVKVTAERTKYLAIEKNVSAVGGVDMANKLRLRAVNVTSGEEQGQAQLVGYVGGEAVVEATDAAAGELSGRFSAVVVGATKAANELAASVDDLVIRVPSPY